MDYASIIQKISSSLITTYQNCIFYNSSNQGDSREKTIIDYLNKVMAHKYGFQSGEVFDSEGNNSGQVDIIIYDNLFSTLFSDGTSKILAPVESTYGIISIKSKMGIKELDNAIKGIESYNKLKRPQPEPNTVYITPDCPISGKNITINGPIQKNINCIFAYDTTIAHQTIKDKIKNTGCIDLLVVPEKLCMIGRSRSELSLKSNDQPLSNLIFTSKQSIAIFTIFLQSYLSKNKLIGNDLQYCMQWLTNQLKSITTQ